MRIVHVITDLQRSGAEAMLCKLLDSDPEAARRQSVLTMLAGDGGSLAGPLRARGIRVESLGLARGGVSPIGLLRLAAALRRERPDIVMGWMYHAMLAATLARLLGGGRWALVWNVRNALGSLETMKPLSRLVTRVCAALSRQPQRIVYNSWQGAERHASHGYRSEQSLVIPNGFDVERYRPRTEARARLRAELGLEANTILIGMIARLHPVKDHPTMFDALARLGGDGRLILIGAGLEPDNADLAARLAKRGIAERVVLLGPRGDVPELLAGLDILALSSRSEGFPNVLGEAMATGVPCVATDVGDCARIVGSTGLIVPPRDPQALADAIGRLLAEGRAGRERRGREARKRVMAHYALPAIVARYDALYADLLGRANPPRAAHRPQPSDGR